MSPLNYYLSLPVLLPQKATRKTDKVRPDELDVTILTDEGLRDELRKHGVDVGPILGERSCLAVTGARSTDTFTAHHTLPQRCGMAELVNSMFNPFWESSGCVDKAVCELCFYK